MQQQPSQPNRTPHSTHLSNMPTSIKHVALLLTALSLFCLPVSATFSSTDYAAGSKWFTGDGTYYGYTAAGNCAMRQLPSVYRNMKAVAINHDQYDFSRSCGACVEYDGNGVGAGANPIRGKHIAYVHDRCPECHHGSLDLSMSGDGRWKIKFRFIPCPFRDDLSFLFEGSNHYYWKLQPRGLKYPVKSVVVNGLHGSRTQDNFFVVQNGGGHRLPAPFVVTDIMGRTFKGLLRSYQGETDIKPSGVSGGAGGGPSSPSKKKPHTPHRPRNRKCVPKWRHCEGPRNFWGVSNCCNSEFSCVNQKGYKHKRCIRTKPKCYPRGRWCKSPGRKQKRPCCGGTVCRKRKRGTKHSFCLKPKSKRRWWLRFTFLFCTYFFFMSSFVRLWESPLFFLLILDSYKAYGDARIGWCRPVCPDLVLVSAGCILPCSSYLFAHNTFK